MTRERRSAPAVCGMGIIGRGRRTRSIALGTLLILVALVPMSGIGHQSAQVELGIPVACGGDWKPLHGQGNFHPTQWDFTASPGEDPGAVGLIWSGNPGVIEGFGNGPCCFHIVAEVFKATGQGPARWLETWIKITFADREEIYHVVSGGGQDQGAMSFWWTVPHYPAGAWTIEIDLGVMRRGYADLPGTFRSKIHLNIANTQNGCPPGHQQGSP